MGAILNVAAYRFTALDDPAGWRDRLAGAAAAVGLKGTILVAGEGLNLSLAGAPGSLRRFVADLLAEPAFAGMPVRESHSDAVPFERLRVRVKPEIIRMNRPTVRPHTGRAPAVAPQTLVRWLDAGHDDGGREVVLLDTRNGFEVDAGRFRGALDWRLAKFGDFPAALDAHRGELAGKTVVSYCTGGIRCEKAALWMAGEGVDGVWQLDGGVLGYLAAVGGRHFDGHCVVFDGRGMLADTLEPVGPV